MGDNVEVEKKYVVKDAGTFEDILIFLINEGIYDVTILAGVNEQVDTYYDTASFDLLKSDKSLRFRTVGESTFITIKKPISRDVLFQRSEFEKEVNSIGTAENKDIITKNLPEIKDINKLNSVLVVENNRKKVVISKDYVQLELVLDDVTYKANDSVEKEWQVEIELKSKTRHKLYMKEIIDKLENNINGLESINISKYQRGMQLYKKDS